MMFSGLARGYVSLAALAFAANTSGGCPQFHSTAPAPSAAPPNNAEPLINVRRVTWGVSIPCCSSSHGLLSLIASPLSLLISRFSLLISRFSLLAPRFSLRISCFAFVVLLTRGLGGQSRFALGHNRQQAITNQKRQHPRRDNPDLQKPFGQRREIIKVESGTGKGISQSLQFGHRKSGNHNVQAHREKGKRDEQPRERSRPR